MPKPKRRRKVCGEGRKGDGRMRYSNTHKKMNHVAHKCWLTNYQAIKHCEVTSHTVRLLPFCAKEKDHTSPMFNMDITHFQFDFFFLNSVMWVNTKPHFFSFSLFFWFLYLHYGISGYVYESFACM